LGCERLTPASGWFEARNKNLLPPVMAQADQYVIEP
jgi:hypothetical protein